MKIKKVVTLLLIFGVLLLGGGYAAYRGYKSARQTRLIKQARGFLANANQRKALITLQRALKYNPKDVEACRLMADLSQRLGSAPAALLWRNRVVEFNPHSLDDRLALVQTALMFRDYAAAADALEGVESAGRKTASYHNLAGAVALTVRKLDQAESHFIEASRLEPTNPVPQLNLAVLHLHSTNAQVQAEARAAIKNISASSPILRCEALRELVGDATRARQTNDALTLSGELVQQTNSSFGDRLLRLSILKEARNPGFKPALADLRNEAGTNFAKIHDLGRWQMENTGAADALGWLLSLSPAMRTNQTVEFLVADCYSTLKNWRALQEYIEHQNWADLEFLRHAYKARALRAQDLSGAAKAEWELALKTANNQYASLNFLLRFAVVAKWESEAEDILWTIVNRFPNEKGAYQTLTQALYLAGRTRPLMQLYSQELKRTPSDLPLKNNLAMTALLLEAFELKPHDLAREVFQKAPTNASYASTYAFSLLVQKKDAEALKVMVQLPPQDLENPSVAGYYGLILKAAGSREKARVYLEWASKARLLPEERKLFERARAGA